MNFPDDFQPIAIKTGMYWNAAYIVPWGKRVVMSKDQPEVFYSKDRAPLAGCRAAMNEFRNQTTGWNETPLQSHQKEIERVFGNAAVNSNAAG